MASVTYVKGMIIDMPSKASPSFVVGRIGIKVSTFLQYLEEHINDNGFVNIDLLRDKEGKLYFKINDWVPKKSIKVAIPTGQTNIIDAIIKGEYIEPTIIDNINLKQPIQQVVQQPIVEQQVAIQQEDDGIPFKINRA